MAFLYSDENFPEPVCDLLRHLGHDVLTAQDAGNANQQIPDDQVLAYATALGRAVLTLDRRDYIRLHKASNQHAGIIVCTQNPDFDQLAGRIDQALAAQPDLAGQLIRITR
jgi:predicted nuclease of predicted toxin-antitoxin system